MSVARVKKLEWPEEEAMATPAGRPLLTIDEFHRMSEAGVLTEDDRVELIRGEIYEMTPTGSRHAACARELNRLFVTGLGERALIDLQNPLGFDDQDSELYPDLAVLRPLAHHYVSKVPGPEDVFLVVEVSDSSFRKDRKIKIPLYAESGIPEAWLVHLEGDVVIAFLQPSPDGYQVERTFRRGETISPQA